MKGPARLAAKPLAKKRRDHFVQQLKGDEQNGKRSVCKE
jgi:hypothetical protein